METQQERFWHGGRGEALQTGPRARRAPCSPPGRACEIALAARLSSPRQPASLLLPRGWGQTGRRQLWMFPGRAALEPGPSLNPTPNHPAETLYER